MAISGRFFFLALAALIPIVAFPGLLTWVLAVSVLLLVLVVDVALAASPRQVAVRRTLPSGVRLGEPATAVLRLFNNSSVMLRAQVKDGWQPSAGALNALAQVRIRAGERAALNVDLLPTRRGDLATHHATIRSFGPLGMAARQHTITAPGVLRVLPPFHSKRHLPSKLRKLRELDGKAAVQIRGAGTEFDSLRDYVRGDDVRSIDWRATARRQDVVVRTWRPERDRRVVIVLDTSRTSATRIEDESALDTGIEASLLLAVLAERGGDRVSLVAYDRRVRAKVSSTGKGNMLNAMVQGLAPLEPELIELNAQGIAGQVRDVTAHRALVVLVTSLDAGAAEEGLIPLVTTLSQKHLVVVASVRDPALERARLDRSTSTLAYRAAAAEFALNRREAITAYLKQAGVEVVDAAPQELPPKLADLYIRLKAAGRL
ncbi:MULTISPECIES: DUF58 domain-containing protein [Arthrobacter]|uniref:DUF58 domain-containing protein n=1 Tax=Arthrobacter psychrochitiniphilus TaxID=291045 RepID=A0A2V3DNQ7_9MICC|nr:MULTISPECIES: DUF58 domain-containing protein [Arthrobacter]NYG18370.1 uncharacterized protein (DUF58 family) [Arthrobacter psychrochitiniphilus]PXA64580.1 DUF58 domain-containing protein [Arthrobacter psychrochitiniphilus]